MQRARGSEWIPKDRIDSRYRERAQSTPIIIVNGLGCSEAHSTMQIQLLEFSSSLLPAHSVTLSPGENMCQVLQKQLLLLEENDQ